MKLALRLVLAFTLGNMLLAAMYGYLAVRREVRVFQETAAEEARTLGRVMEDLLANVWQAAGSQGMLDLVQKINGQQQHIRVRWVWFDPHSEQLFLPSAPVDRLSQITIERHLSVETRDADGTRYLHTYWPVVLSANRPGGLEFSHCLTELETHKREIIERTAWLIGGMAALSGLLAVLLGVRLVGQPLRQLIEKTRRVAAGDLSGNVRLASRDELGELAESLNGMCAQLAQSQEQIRAETTARLAALEQLRHADRLKTVGRLAAGIAHELGTPLNVVSGRAGLIASGKLADDERAKSAGAIKAEAEKMTRIIRQLLDFARASAPHKTPVDLRQVVSQTVELLRPFAEKHGVQLNFARGDAAATCAVDMGQIQQVLTNLLVNAVQAMPAGGPVEIAIRGRTEPSGPRQCVAIRDRGPGIAAENLPHLFEPFFTTKDVGEGTGLGLSIAYGIVQEHGGRIEVQSELGVGSCFFVYLPEQAPEEIAS